MSHRLLQINKVIQAEVADILRKEVDLRDFGLISVHSVSTAPNFRSAKVYVSALKHNHRLLEYLEKQTHHFNQIIGKRLRLRTVPKIFFRMDEDLLRSNRIDDLLAQEEKKLREMKKSA